MFLGMQELFRIKLSSLVLTKSYPPRWAGNYKSTGPIAETAT